MLVLIEFSIVLVFLVVAVFVRVIVLLVSVFVRVIVLLVSVFVRVIVLIVAVFVRVSGFDRVFDCVSCVVGKHEEPVYFATCF